MERDGGELVAPTTVGCIGSASTEGLVTQRKGA